MKLKNDFFCGGKAKAGKNNEGFYVRCTKCGHTLAGFDSKREAKHEWDRQDKTADKREVIS